MIDVIVNPCAGNGLSVKVGAQIEAKLQEENIAYRVHTTERPFHATELTKDAVANGAKTILSVGGDGTAFEVACGLMDSDAALGIIPAGTGNDFIKSINVPPQPLKALKTILAGTPRKVDIGAMNERLFLNCCGVGFDVMVLDYSLKAKKYVRGLLPYLYGVIRTIFTYKPVDVEYSLDGGESVRESVLIFSIANGRFIGGGIPIAPDARVDDGLFDIVTVKAMPRWKIPFYLPGLMMGKVTQFKITTHHRCKEVHLISPNMRLNVDGEILPMDSVHFKAKPNALNVYW